MKPSTNFPEAEADTAAEPLAIHVPHDTHPRLVAMVRRNFAMLDPTITHPPPEAVQ